MRFVLAIVAFVLAAVMLVFGIAQRTIFLEPSSTPLSATIKDGAPYAVLTPEALSAHEGAQTITLDGEGTVFMAYGRTADVEAWLGASSHAVISYSSDDGEFTATASDKKAGDAGSTAVPTTTTASEIVDPAGSDLWLEEFSAEKTLTTTLNLPDGISMIIASDGVSPAPTDVSVSWPVDNSTPWAGPLIVGGAALLLIGLALYAWALLHMRRSRGPRRNLPRGPRMPRLPRAPRPKTIKASEIIRGPKSISKSMAAILPVIVGSSLVLSGCSAEFWPQGSDASDSTVSSTAADAEDADSDLSTATPDPAETVVEPAVTVPQLERIVGEISELTADADATLNAEAISTRFTGPALEQRLANYKIRAAMPEYAAPAALPGSPLNLTLPQQASGWPRVVMTMIVNEDDATVPPTALVLRQESARANYQVQSAVQLEASAEITGGVAPATIGAPVVAPESKLQLVAPGQLAAAYADILMNGEASEFYSLFDAEGDSLRPQIGPEKMGEWRAALPTTASIEFSRVAGAGTPVALGTNDAGAIVAVSVTETEIVKPVDSGATVSPEGSSKALSGLSATAKGIQSNYEDQLLFLVPPAGSTDKIVLLGFSRGLISSAELQ